MAAKLFKTYAVLAIQVAPGHAVPLFQGYSISGINFHCQICDLRSPKKDIMISSNNIKDSPSFT